MIQYTSGNPSNSTPKLWQKQIHILYHQYYKRQDRRFQYFSENEDKTIKVGHNSLNYMYFLFWLPVLPKKNLTYWVDRK